MMKRQIYVLCFVLSAVLCGCSSNTYSDLRNKEDKLISNYISRNGLSIVTEEPDAEHVWGEKEYYKVAGYDNLYFHLITRGDSIRIDSTQAGKIDTLDQKILLNDLIVMRYKQFSLTEDADTLSYWTTLDQAFPLEFHYGNTSECDIIAWHLAIGLMKYPNSQCEIIVPSKLGSSDAQTSVTPYVYILKVKVKQ